MASIRTENSDSAVSTILLSLTPHSHLYSGGWLSDVSDAAKIFWTSPLNRNQIQNTYLTTGPDGLESWKKQVSKISWHYSFNEEHTNKQNFCLPEKLVAFQAMICGLDHYFLSRLCLVIPESQSPGLVYRHAEAPPIKYTKHTVEWFEDVK